jgi:hypothetical protein
MECLLRCDRVNGKKCCNLGSSSLEQAQIAIDMIGRHRVIRTTSAVGSLEAKASKGPFVPVRSIALGATAFYQLARAPLLHIP